MKQKYIKRFSKEEKIEKVLFGLIELYIKEGKPIGSQMLKENGFDYLSSATIRNYFAHLENSGFLSQQHTSGGRLPTDLGYREYIENLLSMSTNSEVFDHKDLEKNFENSSKEIASFLQKISENISEKTNLTVFLKSPHFDQDFIQSIKLVKIDIEKILCIVITDFGFIKTEVIYTDENLKEKEIKQIEDFFIYKIGKSEKVKIDEKLKPIARHFYNELIIRHIISFNDFSKENIYQAGLSKLFLYKEFENPKIFSKILQNFENFRNFENILNETCKAGKICYFIGNDLEKNFEISIEDAAIISIPYKINQITAGSIALFGPMRIPYKDLFKILKIFSEKISEILTTTVYKFKINFKTEKTDEKILLDYEKAKYLEKKF